MDHHSDRLPEWVPARRTSPWRVACWLAGFTFLFDVLALVIADAIELRRCDDGSTNLSQSFAVIMVLVVPATLAAIGAGVYTIRGDWRRRRQATLLIVSVVAAGAVTFSVSYAMLTSGPYLRCYD